MCGISLKTERLGERIKTNKNVSKLYVAHNNNRTTWNVASIYFRRQIVILFYHEQHSNYLKVAWYKRINKIIKQIRSKTQAKCFCRLFL